MLSVGGYEVGIRGELENEDCVGLKGFGDKPFGFGGW